MNKLVLGVVIIAVFIFGVFVGISGSDESSTTSTVSSNPTDSVAEIKETGKIEVNGAVNKTIDGGYTKLVGEVKNNTKRPVTYVKVTATFYDEKGSVIGTNFSYAGDTSSTPLEVGATTPFEITSYPDKFDTEKYKLDVTWN